jgi:dethiobiotin synthetase
LVASNGWFRFDMGAMRQIVFITGTDTAVGKTVLTRLLARFLHARGIPVAALKPVCSGGRADALALHAALAGTLTLDEINPWHFQAPVAPSLAAELEKRPLKLATVLAHIRATQKRFPLTLVEGAGGLLSPLGDDFNSRDLIVALRARPVIVAPNKLGVVNHILLTLEALPKNLRPGVRIILMSPRQPDAATAANAGLLARFRSRETIFSLPWLGHPVDPVAALKKARVRKVFAALAKL